MYLKIYSLIIPLLGMSSSFETNLSEVDWALEAYGSKIEFGIYRKDKKIGNHIVTIEGTKEKKLVKSETNMKFKFLIFTAYKFQYRSTENWLEGKLKSIISKTVDGGKEVKTELFNKDNNLTLPTNHWNPEVLNDSTVFNTITGNLNSVSIKKREWENIKTSSGIRWAQRFDYSGDLKNISAWYDKKGRWVALQFKARDGSLIKYMCEVCGV